MSETRISVDLGASPIGEEETLVVVLRGAPCRTRKAREDLVAMLKSHRTARLAEDAGRRPTKPCGCEEQGAGQR